QGSRRGKVYRLAVQTEHSPKRHSFRRDPAVHDNDEVQHDGLRQNLAPAPDACPAKFGTERPAVKRVRRKRALRLPDELKRCVDTSTPPAEADDIDDDITPGSGLTPGYYVGAAQVMRFDAEGNISYGAGHTICHLTIRDDERITINFLNEQQIWTDV